MRSCFGMRKVAYLEFHFTCALLLLKVRQSAVVGSLRQINSGALRVAWANYQSRAKGQG